MRIGAGKRFLSQSRAAEAVFWSKTVGALNDNDEFRLIEATGPVIELELDPVDAWMAEQLVEEVAALVDGRARGAWVVSCDGKTARFAGEFDDD